jgi:NADH dehydrogenase (ubiquinone) 1 alpha subcomplex subunit 13
MVVILQYHGHDNLRVVFLYGHLFLYGLHQIYLDIFITYPKNVNIGEMVKEYFSSKNKKEEECVCFSIEMEMDESRSCIEPVLLAEQDRIVLRQYRANRDEETKLMNDVPDWKVGTWFGEKVFKSRTYFPDRPHVLDYYGLARPSTQRLDINAGQWQL